VVALYLFGGRGQAIDSLAVLPFVNAAADPNTEYLSDGITESLINSLSQLPKLRVMSRSSVFRYKGRETDSQAVGRELKVQAVLTGRLVQRGENLSLSAELVDARDNTHIWGEQYNRKLADTQAVQQEIAREITDKLRLKLSGLEKQSLAKRHTQNPEAYQDYLKGRYYWNKRTGESLKTAVGHFEQAIAKDPAYAQAYAGLADCYVLQSSLEAVPAREAFPRAKALAQKALEMDETLAEAHAAVAFAVQTHDYDWGSAERHYQRALELNPSYATAHQWYAQCLLSMGRFDQALTQMRRAQELDPLSLIINTFVGVVLDWSGGPDEAIEQLRKTLALDPNFMVAHGRLGGAYMEKSMYREAIAELQTAVQLSGGAWAVAGCLGYAYAVSGNQIQARQILDEFRRRASRQYVPALAFAMVYTGLGDKDRAFEWLSKAVEERGQHVTWLKVNPLWDPLRSDPRFTDLLRRMNLAP